MKEEWLDIVCYEGLYQVSSLGKIRSLNRTVKWKNGVRTLKGKIISGAINNTGHRYVSLCKHGKHTKKYVHRLVASMFFKVTLSGHKIVVNHIDYDKLNNNKTNLEVITQRINSNQKHLKSTSKYTGVHQDKGRSVWRAGICINGKNIRLGSFKTEIKASKAYEEALLLHTQGKSVQSIIEKYKQDYSSKYFGVSYMKKRGRWRAGLRNKHIGCYGTEEEANIAVQEYTAASTDINNLIEGWYKAE